MKFLVVLICLLINHYWREQRNISAEAWFPAFQSWLGARLKQVPAVAVRFELVFPAALLLLPLLLLVLVLWVSAGLMLGFVTLALHILVLLIAFDRLNIIHLSGQYLSQWRAGDYEGAWRLLEEQAPDRFAGSFVEYSGLHKKFFEVVVASYFERLFAVIFWYLLLGPIGVLLYAAARLIARNESENESTWQDALIPRLVFILEWLPARALALTFSLAGDFVAAFHRLRENFLSQAPAQELVKACAIDASESSLLRTSVKYEELAPTATFAGGMESPGSYPQGAARQIDELLSLMFRSQVIWLTVLALLTVYGFGN
jgi:AmpE protein